MFVRSSELLLSIPAAKRNNVPPTPESTFSTSTPARSRSPRPSLSFANPSPAPAAVLAVPVTPLGHHHTPHVHLETGDAHTQDLEWEIQDEDALATARACIHAKEFLRAAHILSERKSAKAQFLRLYSQFLVRVSQDSVPILR